MKPAERNAPNDVCVVGSDLCHDARDLGAIQAEPLDRVANQPGADSGGAGNSIERDRGYIIAEIEADDADRLGCLFDLSRERGRGCVGSPPSISDGPPDESHQCRARQRGWTGDCATRESRSLSAMVAGRKLTSLRQYCVCYPLDAVAVYESQPAARHSCQHRGTSEGS